MKFKILADLENLNFCIFEKMDYLGNKFLIFASLKNVFRKFEVLRL